MSDERTRLIARLLDRESMSDLYEELRISRKTGYKIWNRYQNSGAYALMDRSRKPQRFGNQLAEQVERTIVRLKKREGLLESSQDTPIVNPPLSELTGTGCEHRACRPGSSRPGQLPEKKTSQARR